MAEPKNIGVSFPAEILSMLNGSPASSRSSKSDFKDSSTSSSSNSIIEESSSLPETTCNFLVPCALSLIKIKAVFVSLS